MDPSAPRTLRTLIALHEESSGACVAYPVMRPEWAAFGDRDDVLTELRLFLEAQVRKLSAPEVAHLHLAPDVSGRLVPVTLGRVDLPHALRHASEVVFPCALIPKGTPTGWSSSRCATRSSWSPTSRSCLPSEPRPSG
jgi:hypothetical protein